MRARGQQGVRSAWLAGLRGLQAGWAVPQQRMLAATATAFKRQRCAASAHRLQVEALGVERSQAAAAAADIVIMVLDASVGWTAQDGEIFAALWGHGVGSANCKASAKHGRVGS